MKGSQPAEQPVSGLPHDKTTSTLKLHDSMAKTTHSKSFGPGPDTFLEAFYAPFGTISTQQKIQLLQLQMGGTSNFYALGGHINDDMKLACLEYEYLEQAGKIELVLA